MQQENYIKFELLKSEIAAAMKAKYPGMNSEISDWKGQEITDFQEDLLEKVNGRLSEKWFYTHIKSKSRSLPRIDVLNMLSQYAGYLNWDDFRHRHSEQLHVSDKPEKNRSIYIMMPSIMILALLLLFVLYKIVNTQNYTFSFIDSDSGDPIESSNVQMDLLQKNESPINYISDSKGNIRIRTDQSRIKFIVSAPYYMTDTIIRILKKFNKSEKIKLTVDSYALMLKYFSQTDIAGWNKRRELLNKIISDDALICQLPDLRGVTGMELFNKQEFIDKMTMPSSSLNQIEILDSKYVKGQIAVLRFRINMKKNESNR